MRTENIKAYFFGSTDVMSKWFVLNDLFSDSGQNDLEFWHERTRRKVWLGGLCDPGFARNQAKTRTHPEVDT